MLRRSVDDRYRLRHLRRGSFSGMYDSTTKITTRRSATMRATPATRNHTSSARRIVDVGVVSVVAACLVAVFAAAPAVAAPAGGPVPSGFEPASVSFISADDGWVLGSAPCSNPVCTSIAVSYTHL